jgi:tetratricopeptide (TPR) repeat protein
MSDWIGALIARGLLSETQGVQLRAIHESGAHRKPSVSLEPPVPPPPDAARVLACTKCSCVYTGEGEAAVCPRCGGPLKAFELGGPLVPSEKGEAKKRGKRFGRYVLQRTLGKGGMGVVYEAWDNRLQRRVALKMLAAEADELDPESVERFQREARSAAKLKHPAIVGMLDIGREAGRHYLTMEYVEGLSMHDRLYAPDAAMSFPTADRIAVLTRVASALAAAHAAGIVHRDLKPSNILIDKAGLAFLTDFGLARDLQAKHHERLTVSGSVLGTFEFMSPEQVDSSIGSIGPASDVFSFGVVLFLALTGDLPAEKDALPSLQAVARKPLPRASARNPAVPPHLDRLCARCLKRDPAERPKDGAALSAALAIRPASSARRRRALAVAGVLGSVALVAFLAGLGAGRSGRRPATGSGPAADGPGDSGESGASPSHGPTVPPDIPKTAASLKTARDLLSRPPGDKSNPRREPVSAEAMARQLLAADPGNVEVACLLAEARMRLGRMDDGAQVYRGALKDAPDCAPAALALAWDALLRQRTEGLSPSVEHVTPPAASSLAAVFERAATASWADDLERAAARGAAAFLADRPYDARTACDEALSLARESPRRWRALWLLATLPGVGRASDSMEVVARSLVPDPLALCALGALLDRAGKTEAAAAAWNQALEAEERCAPALHGLAAQRRRAGFPGEALALLSRALAADPDWAPALLDRAAVHLDTSPPALVAALDDLDRLCALRPASAAARFHRARARAARGDLASAADEYLEALKLDDTRADAWFGSADALRVIGKRSVALDHVRRGLAIKPDSENGHVLQVSLLTELGNRKDALAAAAESIGRFPGSTRLRMLRIPLLIAEQRFDDALEDADAAVEGLPEDPAPRKLRLLLRYRRNDWKGELEDALWVRERMPDDADGIFWCGVARYHLKDYLNARADFIEVKQKAAEGSSLWLQARSYLERLDAEKR